MNAGHAPALPPHLRQLENDAVHALRDGVACARNPVLLFSGGKDSTVLAYIAARAFAPAKPPLPLLHIDSTWEFRDLLAFRDAFARRHGFELAVHRNEEGARAGINPFDHGERYTTVMRTDALKQALDRGRYDVVFGGARRDEDPARAKERVVSLRGEGHAWDPRRQRPELWNAYNWELLPGQSIRAFPLSNWTEEDLWSYVVRRRIELCPLYFAAPRRVLRRDGLLVSVDDESRMRWQGGERAHEAMVRFRTLGCWPVTGAVESNARDAGAVLLETWASARSERVGRGAAHGTLESQKREGYF